MSKFNKIQKQQIKEKIKHIIKTHKFYREPTNKEISEILLKEDGIRISYEAIRLYYKPNLTK